MVERPGSGLRPIGMRRRWVGMLVALPLLLAGCGDDEAERADPDGSSSAPSSSASPSDCVPMSEETGPVSEPDLDGDGVADSVEFVDQRNCPGALVARVGEQNFITQTREDLPVGDEDMRVVELPGRTGEVLLVTARHPRGGFQARLFGYADGSLEELTLDGEAIFDFIATDVLSTPIAASCVDGGFRVDEARRHEPVGIIPAWDIYRTTYAVDGNDVTAGPTTEVADNVLDEQLHEKYADLVAYEMFENCRVDR